MKILIVTGIFPPDHGGPASYVPEIAAALAEKHTIVSVITLSDRLDEPKQAHPFHVKRILRKQSKFTRGIQTIFAIRKYAKYADVIYVNGLVFESIIACKMLLRRPVVTKVVGDLSWEKARISNPITTSLDEFQRGNHGLKWNLFRWIYRLFIRKSDAIIVPSKYLYRIVSGWKVADSKIVLVYNSAKYDHASNHLSPEPKRVDCITVARLVPWKGIRELIDITCENGWSLTIIGDGPLRHELEHHAKKMKNCHIDFLGHIPHKHVISEISKAKVFVLNSTYEGLPHIILEAKLAGVAVVATAAGGTPETIEDGVNGYLVTPGDKPGLSKIIKHLLSDDTERNRIARQGRIQVINNFSYEEMVHQTENTLLSACQYPIS